MKTIIVGGVAGGASCAARLRRINEDCEIVLFERGEYISFANCGLPYYIGDVIDDKEKLFVQTPASMKKRFNIDVRILSEVVEIAPDKKIVTIRDLKNNNTYVETYDKLVLAPGANPMIPSMPGIKNKNVFTLWSIKDTYGIKDYIEYYKPKHAVVVGGGFIGLEMVENLYNLGINTTVVELSNQVMGPIDYEMACLVHSHLKEKNIEFILGDGIKEIKHEDDNSTVVLNSGKSLNTDMIIVSIGIRPEITLAKSANLEIGALGGIKVNKNLLTSNPDIYACGDAIEIEDYISKKPALIPLAGPANKQGRIVANNICGQNEEYIGTQGSSVVKVFDLTVAFTGKSEKALKRDNIPYKKAYTHSSSHATYYPDSMPISIKLLFSPDNGLILGAQAIGYDGVEKRIDVIATAIRGSMTVYDLEELELCYAPPYSSAKDPVNIIGFVASNTLKDEAHPIYWDEIESINKENTILLDVRTESEYSLGTIDGAINIPVDDLRQNLDRLDSNKEIIIFCQIGLRGYIADRMLTQLGYRVKNLSGGYKTYYVTKIGNTNTDIYKQVKMDRKDAIVASSPSESLLADTITIDACGLSCPGPILKVNEKIASMNNGEVLEVTATDPAFGSDISSWCNKTCNELMEVKKDGKKTIVKIKKSSPEQANCTRVTASANGTLPNDKTIVVFSDDLDKAIASFIIANGAASMGRHVTMFFTFWGLNLLRKSEKVKVNKNLIENMFGFMMPKGSTKLSLSKMNMGGIGSRMIRVIMRKKNILSLEDLIKQAQKQGIRIVACSMSSDVMGIKQEELLDGVEIAGVATYLEAAENSDTNLFI